MNQEQIDQQLQELAAELGDRRHFLCDLMVTSLAEDTCRVGGTVMAQNTITAVQEKLTVRVPQLDFDFSAVRVLEQEEPVIKALSTNLAGLHRSPSRTTELQSQLLNGNLVTHLVSEGSWAFVRQADGYLGWVQGGYLTPDLPAEAADHLVTAPVALLYDDPGDTSGLAGRVFAGTAVHVAAQDGDWAKLALVGEHTGWVHRDMLQACVDLPQQAADQRARMVSAAQAYIGVPYQWGGCTIYGIDCSGLAQLMHRLCGITLPRDADMQFQAGRPVEPPFQPGDLLYFGSGEGARKITHVALSLGDWDIIHSSGPRNGVYVDNVQEAPWLRDLFAGANTFISDGAG